VQQQKQLADTVSFPLSRTDDTWPDIACWQVPGGGVGTLSKMASKDIYIPHLFGPGTTLFDRYVGFLGFFFPTGRLVVFRKEPQDRQKQTFILNFIPLPIEDEAVISTSSQFDHQTRI